MDLIKLQNIKNNKRFKNLKIKELNKKLIDKNKWKKMYIRIRLKNEKY